MMDVFVNKAQTRRWVRVGLEMLVDAGEWVVYAGCPFS